MDRSTITALRQLARKPKPAGEHCELCGVLLPADHPHLLQLTTRRITCACDACAILFEHRNAAAKYLRIPRQIRRIENFRISDMEWAGLMLPIDMVYILRNTAAGRPVAYYPSPAGATESLLHLDAWDDLVRNNSILERLLPDVEALLINRTQGSRDYYIAPLDECYKLTGLIRVHWRGLSGGDAVWREIGHFFDSLRARATESAHA